MSKVLPTLTLWYWDWLQSTQSPHEWSDNDKSGIRTNKYILSRFMTNIINCGFTFLSHLHSHLLSKRIQISGKGSLNSVTPAPSAPGDLLNDETPKMNKELNRVSSVYGLFFHCRKACLQDDLLKRWKSNSQCLCASLFFSGCALAKYRTKSADTLISLFAKGAWNFLPWRLSSLQG